MRRRTLLASLLVSAAAVAGCDSRRLAKGREAFYRGEPAVAAEILAPLSLKAGRNEVLYALERGTALHAAGRLDEANAEFLKAAERIKDWETKSVSKEAAALAYSDAAKPYQGAPHEQLLAHTFLMMGFYADGRMNEALVEARRAVEILSAADRPAYSEDPFTRFLAALAFDIRGADDDAYIELKKVQELAPGFPYAKAPLLRLARATGRTEDAGRWRALPGEPLDFQPGGGLLVALIGTGAAPRKVQRDLVIPPYYRLAAPALEDRPQATRGAVVRVGSRQAPAFPLTDVAAAAKAHLADRVAATVAKETGRAVGSEFVARWLDREEGDLATVLFRVAYFATRVADTRSWETLPARLQVAVLPLPAGTHDVAVHFLGEEPGPLLPSVFLASIQAPPVKETLLFPGLSIREGRYTFIAARGL